MTTLTIESLILVAAQKIASNNFSTGSIKDPCIPITLSIAAKASVAPAKIVLARADNPVLITSSSLSRREPVIEFINLLDASDIIRAVFLRLFDKSNAATPG